MCPEASHLLRDPGQDVASYGKLLMTFRAAEQRTGSLVVPDEQRSSLDQRAGCMCVLLF